MYFYISKILAPVINLSNFLFFIIIIFYLLDIYFKKNFFKKVFIFTSFVFIFISLFPVGNYGLKYLESEFIKQTKLHNYDNIIVLSGGEDHFSTKITKKLNLNSSSERLISSVKLALNQPNSKIIFLGGNGLLSKNKFDEAEVAKIFFNDIGFDIKRVIFVNTSRNTIENLKEFKKLNLNKYKNILLTSSFHMKRALLIAEKLNLEFIPYAVDFRSLKSEDNLINSYQNYQISQNLVKFDIFFKEILGIIVAKLIL